MAPEALAEARRLAGTSASSASRASSRSPGRRSPRASWWTACRPRPSCRPSEGLLPEGHPDRISVHALKALIESQKTNGKLDRTVAEELQALVALARA